MYPTVACQTSTTATRKTIVASGKRSASCFCWDLHPSSSLCALRPSSSSVSWFTKPSWSHITSRYRKNQKVSSKFKRINLNFVGLLRGFFSVKIIKYIIDFFMLCVNGGRCCVHSSRPYWCWNGCLSKVNGSMTLMTQNFQGKSVAYLKAFNVIWTKTGLVWRHWPWLSEPTPVFS